ncbi:MAG: tRNA (guanosine(37)-N1)-methyltransferase TrmD [Candidatus Tectomicrobia bacterium]|uniref:tRNA (guanine-N(1)-)-methyltransferase n=1 Tax=Tectimicrobiota bacterium TaxID=2528274 RepID=A0A933GMJ0_UNCTE|nr:tRNA (guanosine(37)-N1)-methyltransferase TrmD [Candidatus Tectomicrobia bacterium]
MEFHILSLFTEMFNSVFDSSIIKKARDRKLIEIFLHNIRDYTYDSHRVTDDYPYGGGAGMVLKVEPIARALKNIEEEKGPSYKIMMGPQGNLFNQDKAKELANHTRVIIICGHYEGVDERVRQYFIDEEISIGDYVLSGGEIAAMVVTDTVSRLIPGVLGNSLSIETESFSSNLLDYPQYTRPREYLGLEVPEVLLSGNHAEIRNWRLREAFRKTVENRPDLLGDKKLSPEQEKLLKSVKE